MSTSVPKKVQTPLFMSNQDVIPEVTNEDDTVVMHKSQISQRPHPSSAFFPYPEGNVTQTSFRTQLHETQTSADLIKSQDPQVVISSRAMQYN